jgi:hypothetical protein
MRKVKSVKVIWLIDSFDGVSKRGTLDEITIPMAYEMEKNGSIKILKEPVWETFLLGKRLMSK